MTVEELIEQLQKCDNKKKEVLSGLSYPKGLVILVRFAHSLHDQPILF